MARPKYRWNLWPKYSTSITYLLKPTQMSTSWLIWTQIYHDSLAGEGINKIYIYLNATSPHWPFGRQSRQNPPSNLHLEFTAKKNVHDMITGMESRCCSDSPSSTVQYIQHRQRVGMIQRTATVALSTHYSETSLQRPTRKPLIKDLYCRSHRICGSSAC